MVAEDEEEKEGECDEKGKQMNVKLTKEDADELEGDERGRR